MIKLYYCTGCKKKIGLDAESEIIVHHNKVHGKETSCYYEIENTNK